MTTKGELIGEGRTAQIYAWGDGQAVKLFRTEFPAHWAQYEARVAETVGKVCPYAPAMYGTVEIEEEGVRRTGIVYERVTGPTMVQIIMRQPWRTLGLTRQFARVHAAIHAVHDPALASLPSLVDHTRYDVQHAPVSEAVKGRALASLEARPTGDCLCHRDFHPEQVIFTGRGPVVLDWMTAAAGPAVADVARTSLILSAGSVPLNTPRMKAIVINALRATVHRLYLRTYAQARPFDRAELEAWRAILAIGRLNEHIPGEEAYLRGLIKGAFD